MKPLGSEKLQGSEKLNRILELTYYNSHNDSSSKKAEYVAPTVNEEHVYGIVKEKDGYYVKRGLNESSLDYIGGMFMKNKNRFSSYAEALKRLEFLKGRENLTEATKYVLKQNKPEPAPLPTEELPPVPMDPATSGNEPSPEGDTGTAPLPGDESTDQVDATKPSSYMTEVQKLSGKLGQELRDRREEMKSDDIKYALMMIISAVDLEKLDDDDIEEIAAKFERDESFEDKGGEAPAELPADVAPEDGGEEELAEEDPMHALESFINSKPPRPMKKKTFNPEDFIMQFDEEDDYNFDDEEIQENEEEDNEVELDLDEIAKDIGNTLKKYFNK